MARNNTTETKAPTEAKAPKTPKTPKTPKAPKAAPEKVINDNGIRPALVEAHNKNNSKAIDGTMCKEAGVDTDHLTQWILEIEGAPTPEAWCNSENKIPSLYKVVKEYVDIKLSKDARIKTPEAMKEKYNAIFPVWREILEHGEAQVFVKELKVEADDVESLVGYMEIFVPTARGTQRSTETRKIFRKYVEALLGWKMAKNEALAEAEATLIMTYERNVSKKNTLETEKIPDQKAKIAFFEHKIAEAKSDEFKEYLTQIRKDLEHGKKDVEGKVVEAGLDQMMAELKECDEFIKTKSDEYIALIDKLELLK